MKVSRETPMFFQYSSFWFLIFYVTLVNGFPSQCKDDKYFDHLKQIYLPCSECDKNQLSCQMCCSTSEADLMDASIPSHTVPMPSMEERSDKFKYRILNIFLQSFITMMVVCTLLVLVYVAWKVSRERQATECLQGNHFQNEDASIIQEVLAVDPSSTAGHGDVHGGTSAVNLQTESKNNTKHVNITVNNLQEGKAKDIPSVIKL